MLRLVGRSESLLVGEKVQNDISSIWTVGRVISIEFGRDGIPKRAKVEYYNPSKFFAQKQITDRAAESLVKLFNEEDSTCKDDMEEISDYSYVFPKLVGVLDVTNKFLEIE